MLLPRHSLPRSAKGHRKATRLNLLHLEDRSVPSAAYHLKTIAVGFATGNPADPVQTRAVPVEAGQTVDQAIASWGAKPGVAYAEPNYVLANSATPNDPYFSLQYAQLNNGQTVNGVAGTAGADTEATQAWNVTNGKASTVVAVIDTGIDYTHPDLYKNIWINQNEIPASIRSNLADLDADGRITFWDLNNTVNIGTGKAIDLNTNGYIDGGDLIRTIASGGWADGLDQGVDGYVDDIIGWDFLGNDNDPMDLTAENGGHGTHVAGTIGAMGNNGVGVAGVNWQVEMMAMRFIGSTGGSSTAAAAAIRLAADNGAAATNNSWGGGGYSQTTYDAINYARGKGSIFVAAAGNNGANNDTTAFYPSNYNLDNVVAVAATDNRDQLASFSNYGKATVDIAAPGVNIVSTYPGGQYYYMSGTSMAAPQVTGAIALLRGNEPGLTYSQAIARVFNSADPLSNLTNVTVTGGRLNVYTALTTAPVDATGAAVTTMTPNATGTNAVSSVRLTFSEAISAGTFTTADVTITGPNGTAITPTGVTAVGTTGTQFDLTFASQFAAGSYSVKVGPAVSDLTGNLMDQNRNGVNGQTTDVYAGTFAISAPTTPTTTRYTNATAVAIPDRSTVASSITITQNVAVSDLNVLVNITHANVGDLTVTLTGPDGTRVTLINRRGGTGDNLSNTYFDDEAATGIRNGTAPFTGSFRPEQLLSAFDGKSTLGTWTLRVSDNSRGVSGTLLNWSLDVTTVGPLAVTSLGTLGIGLQPVAPPALANVAATGTQAPTAPAANSRAVSLAPLWVLFTDDTTTDPFTGTLDPFTRRLANRSGR